MSLHKSYTLNTKITLLFIALGFFLLTILFVQIIPNMKTEQKKEKIHQIENMLTLTNEQLKLAIQHLIHSKQTKIEEVESELYQYILQLQQKYTNEIELVEMLNKKRGCYFTLKEVGNEKLVIFDDMVLEQNKLALYVNKQNHMCPKQTKYFFYMDRFKDGKNIISKCEAEVFVNKHEGLEETIKQSLQKSFNLTYEEHKGKINLIWINTNHKDYETKPLYDVNDEVLNPKYCLSRMSSAKKPQVGNLTAKQIVDASNKEPIFHKLENKKFAYTWVKTLNSRDNVKLLFLTTIYEEDFKKNLASPFSQVFPAAMLSLVIAIFLGVFLFRRLFYNINLLTNTAKEVNKGNINIRNSLNGDDDIAYLGKAFDSMLDSLQENINTLDQKVASKTKELSDSLQQKDVLLKEIHHRVKNNLAMTINLIKLQNRKIDDDKTKQILLNIQERIYTMELLHRKLYESKDLSSIPFKTYVEELCFDLQTTYGDDFAIPINCKIEDISLDIEHALPCGLLITECLTNTYKYAFKNQPKDVQEKIDVLFFKKGKNCSLIIKDNGVGLPKDLDFTQVKSLGLRLIRSIVEGQLLGRIQYKYDDGASFFIDFDID